MSNSQRTTRVSNKKGKKRGRSPAPAPKAVLDKYDPEYINKLEEKSIPDMKKFVKTYWKAGYDEHGRARSIERWRDLCKLTHHMVQQEAQKQKLLNQFKKKQKITIKPTNVGSDGESSDDDDTDDDDIIDDKVPVKKGKKDDKKEKEDIPAGGNGDGLIKDNLKDPDNKGDDDGKKFINGTGGTNGGGSVMVNNMDFTELVTKTVVGVVKGLNKSKRDTKKNKVCIPF